MQHLSREKRIYYLDPEGEPAITIDSGEELMVETWDAFEGIRDPQILDAKALKGPATGPIYVNGAEPGDALKVEFLKITPKEGPAHMVMPGRGFLEEEFTEGLPDGNDHRGGQDCPAQRRQADHDALHGPGGYHAYLRPEYRQRQRPLRRRY